MTIQRNRGGPDRMGDRMKPNTDAISTAGIILAGGLSRRMRTNKSFCTLNQQPLIAHAIERLRPQLDLLAINATPDIHALSESGEKGESGKSSESREKGQSFDAFALDVIPDVLDGHCGPLAGILTGMLWAKRQQRRFLISVATDAPFLPKNLVRSLHEHRQQTGADIVCAASGGRHHPTIALWPVELAEKLDHALRHENIRKIDQWTARFRCEARSWPNTPWDPFFNINRTEDLAQAEAIIKQYGTI